MQKNIRGEISLRCVQFRFQFINYVGFLPIFSLNLPLILNITHSAQSENAKINSVFGSLIHCQNPKARLSFAHTVLNMDIKLGKLFLIPFLENFMPNSDWFLLSFVKGFST